MQIIFPLKSLKKRGMVNEVAGEESKILVDGVMLLITSLLSGIVSLIVYVWASSRREHDRQMMAQEKRLETLETSNKDHECRLIRIETEHVNSGCMTTKKR